MTGVGAPLLTIAGITAIAIALRPTAKRTPAPPPSSPIPAGRASRLRIRWAERRPVRSPDATAVAAWCDDLARELRSGTTLRQALTSVAPADAATDSWTAPWRLGLERAQRIDGVVEGAGAHLQLAIAVIAAAAEAGGSAAPAIDRVAATLRQRAADRDERRAQAAQARLSAHVMTAVPLVMLGLLVLSDHDVRAVLATPAGAGCVAAGLALNASGWFWMRRVVGAPT